MALWDCSTVKRWNYDSCVRCNVAGRSSFSPNPFWNEKRYEYVLRNRETNIWYIWAGSEQLNTQYWTLAMYSHCLRFCVSRSHRTPLFYIVYLKPVFHPMNNSIFSASIIHSLCVCANGCIPFGLKTRDCMRIIKCFESGWFGLGAEREPLV